MTAIIKNNFRLQSAKDFLTKVSTSSPTSNLYLFVGKPLPFQDDITPPTPVDTLDEENRIWDEMVGLKRILDSNITLVVPRVNWQSDVTYDIFDDKDGDLYINRKFYVLTSDYNVFICIQNNNNSPSTVEPLKPNSQDIAKNITSSDGYVWKYMTTIGPSDAVNFLTDSWMPVKKLSTENSSDQWDVQVAAKSNSILSIKIENGGSGYYNLVADDSRKLIKQSDRQLNISNMAALGLPTNLVNNYSIYIHISDSNIKRYDITEVNINDGIISVSSDLDPNMSTIEPGHMFEILPKIQITSNINDIVLKPKVENTSIKNVLVEDGKENVNFANIQILGGETSASVRAIISPSDGLGANIENDLGAFFVMLNAKLKFDEGDGDFPKTNDYRQIGIIQDVFTNSNILALDLTLNPTNSLLLPNNSSLIIDQEIQQGTTKAKLVEIKNVMHDGQNFTRASYIQTPETGYGEFEVNGSLTQNGVTIEIENKLTSEIKKRKGKILYIENRRPILRAENQVEDIKTILEF